MVLLRLFWRSLSNPFIRRNWQQRLGFINLKPSPRIWLHAVSVGETIAATPLVESLLLNYPHHKLLISNTTATGYKTTTRLFGNRVEQCYIPYDINACVSTFLSRSNPCLLIIMETEIWPNLLHQCKSHRVPMLIANARLSERSTIRYLKILPLIKSSLNQVDKIACRSDTDVENFMRLGAATKQLETIRNIKFDVLPSHEKINVNVLKQQLGNHRKIWVAASTHKGEDELILSCFSQLKATHHNLVLVLVPRHPERFEIVFDRCKQTHYTIQRRSNGRPFTKDCDIILGDSMGEMPNWYACADVVFLGGSLVNTGGHNPLEATVYGVPVVSGPFIFNFHDVYAVLCKAEVAWIKPDLKTLTKKLNELLAMPESDLMTLRVRAKQTLKNNKGATKKILKMTHDLINTH